MSDVATAGYPDLDDPGYMRHCIFSGCGSAFHVFRGPAEGWLLGHRGPIYGGYICPAHAPIVTGHVPRWWMPDTAVAGTLCDCGWKWLPGERAVAAVHLERWLSHLPTGSSASS